MRVAREQRMGEFTALLGIPWKQGGDHPQEGMDCWGAVREVYRIRGFDVPSLPFIWRDMRRDQTLDVPVSDIDREASKRGWEVVTKYPPLKDMDIIVSSPGKDAERVHTSVVIDSERLLCLSSSVQLGVYERSFFRLDNVIAVYRPDALLP